MLTKTFIAAAENESGGKANIRVSPFLSKQGTRSGNDEDVEAADSIECILLGELLVLFAFAERNFIAMSTQ